MTLRWPIPWLMPRSTRTAIVNPSRSGGRSLAGQQQDVQSPAAYWTIAYSGVILDGLPGDSPRDGRTRSWITIANRLKGRSRAILVPALECWRKPASTLDSDPLPFSDGTEFSDGTGWAGLTVIATAGAALAGETELVITMTVGSAPQPPQVFSIGERLYRIDEVVDVSDDVSTVKIWPPLREDVAADTELDFDRPACRMKLATPDAMTTDMDFLWRARPSVSFEEDL